MSTLYELTAQFKELLEMIEQGETDEQTLEDTLEGIDGEIEYKADGYVKVIKELEGQALTVSTEITRLLKKSTYIENNVKRLKETLENAMKATGKKKIKTDLFSLSIQKNGGKQKLDIYGAVPDKFTKTEVKADNDKIRQAIADGQILDFAVLQERGEGLRIR